MPRTEIRPPRTRRWQKASAIFVATAAALSGASIASADIASALPEGVAESVATVIHARTSPTLARSARKLAAQGCAIHPNRKNTGASGHLRRSSRTTLRNHATLKNAKVSNLTITGSHVKVSNVAVSGGILVLGKHVSIKHVTAQAIAISSGSDVTVARSHLRHSPSDAFHVTSDRGRKVRSVRLRYNLVDKPRVVGGDHYDGLQVRGVSGLTVRCNVFRAGAYHYNYNAGVFLEDANGGDSRVRVVRNWIVGWAFSVMVQTPSSAFVRNHVAKPHWRPCYLRGPGFYSRGNTRIPDGKKVNLCGRG